MECGLDKPISFWPRSEVFSFGVFPIHPHPRLSVNIISKLISHVRSKSTSDNLKLRYKVWKHFACNKLNFTEETAWGYFETCLVLSCPRMENLTHVESAVFQATDAEKESFRNQQSVDLHTFALFLYVNQINRVSLRSSAASVSGEWPESPSKSTDALSSRSAVRIFRNNSVQHQLEFITDCLREILQLLSEPDAGVGSAHKHIHQHALEALSFIFEGTVDRLVSIKPLRDVLLDPVCISYTGYNRALKSFNMKCLYSWMRSNLCQCPFSFESCMLNGTSIQLGISSNTVRSHSARSPRGQRQRITTNVQRLPPSTSFRGNKIIAVDMLHKQFVARASRFMKFATVKIHRATSSSVYLLVPLRCVVIDRCRNSTIVLGPVESTLMVSDCEDCVVVAPARRVVVWASRRCTLHLLCATQPLVLHQSASTAAPSDPHSCPPSPLGGVGRGRNPLANEDLVFAPYHTTYPELRRHVQQAAIDPSVNYWDKPLLFGSDYLRSGASRPEGVWGLLPPENFFPFNIPLASEEAAMQGSSGADVYGGADFKPRASDVCRGAIIGIGNGQPEASERGGEESDSSTRKTPLLVPLPPAYGEAVRQRRTAYENWQRAVQDADLSEGDNMFLLECIEKQFKTWLEETGLLNELKILDKAANISAAVRVRRKVLESGMDVSDAAVTVTTPSSFPRSVSRQHRHYSSSSTAV